MATTMRPARWLRFRLMLLGGAIVAAGSWAQMAGPWCQTCQVDDVVSLGVLDQGVDSDHPDLQAPLAVAPSSVVADGAYIYSTSALQNLIGRFSPPSSPPFQILRFTQLPTSSPNYEILHPRLMTIGECPVGADRCAYVGDFESCTIYMANLTTGALDLFSGGGRCAGDSAEGRIRQQAVFPALSAIGFAAGQGLVLGTCDYRYNEHLLLLVPFAGPVSRVAGMIGASGYGGDNGPATSARLNCPTGNVLVQANSIAFADQLNNRVREIENGTITTSGGTGQGGPADHGDGGLAVNARIGAPTCVAEHGGELFVCQGLSIRAIDNITNVIRTVVGKGQAARKTGLKAVDVTAGRPTGIAFDPTGVMWFGDDYYANIVAVALDGTVYNAAGTPDDAPTPWYYTSGENRPTNETAMGLPSAVVRRPSGELLFADPADNRIKAADLSSNLTYSFAGTGKIPVGLDLGDGGPANQAKLFNPEGLTIFSDGVVISERYGCRLRYVDQAGDISTIAGTGSCSSNPAATGPGTTIALGQPRGLATDDHGTLFWAEITGQMVRKMAAGVVSRVAGTGVAGIVPDPDGMPATGTKLRDPIAVAVEPDGSRLYVIEFGRHTIRYVDFTETPPRMHTLAGDGVAGFRGDGGPASAARFNGPTGLEYSNDGLLVSDTGNNVIRAITDLHSATPQIKTIAGNTQPGRWGRGGPALLARIFGPSATLTTDTAIYFAELHGRRIGKLTVASTPPPPPAGPPGAPGTPTASVNGNDVAFNWTAPATGVSPFTYLLIGRLVAGGPIVGTLAVGAATAAALALPNGHFVVSVQATNAQGTGPESAGVAIDVPAVPPAPGPPSNLAVTVANTAAQFTWTPPATGGAPGTFVLVASLFSGGPAIATLPFAANTASDAPAAVVNSYSVPNVPPGTYFVRLHAQNAGGTSAASNEVTVVVAAPAAPGPPVLQSPVVTGTTVILTWTPAGTGGTATGFLVTASLTPGGATVASIGTSNPTLTVTNVPPGTYYVKVRAVNAVGPSLPSNEVPVVVS